MQEFVAVEVEVDVPAGRTAKEVGEEISDYFEAKYGKDNLAGGVKLCVEFDSPEEEDQHREKFASYQTSDRFFDISAMLL